MTLTKSLCVNATPKVIEMINLKLVLTCEMFLVGLAVSSKGKAVKYVG